jgi:hypothetical protein
MVRYSSLVVIVWMVGCGEATPVPAPAPVASKPIEAPKPVDPYASFKKAATIMLEDVQKPVTPQAMKDTWKLVDDEYRKLRMESDAKPASDLYDKLTFIRTVFDLEWQRAMISDTPWERRELVEHIDKAKALIEKL